jgi:hypothetical protein
MNWNKIELYNSGNKIIIYPEGVVNNHYMFDLDFIENASLVKIDETRWELTGDQQQWKCPYKEGAYTVDEVYPEYVTNVYVGFWKRRITDKKIVKCGWIRLKENKPIKRTYINVPIEIRDK